MHQVLALECLHLSFVTSKLLSTLTELLRKWHHLNSEFRTYRMGWFWPMVSSIAPSMNKHKIWQQGSIQSFVFTFVNIATKFLWHPLLNWISAPTAALTCLNLQCNGVVTGRWWNSEELAATEVLLEFTDSQPRNIACCIIFLETWKGSSGIVNKKNCGWFLWLFLLLHNLMKASDFSDKHISTWSQVSSP